MDGGIESPAKEAREARHDVIQRQLRDILESAEFVRSPRLQQFLDLIVHAAIQKTPEQMKETQIGAQVYGRPLNYDPKSEPIVRTEARRLRSKLAEYYRKKGVDAPVIITIPVGGYTPKFEVRNKTRRLVLLDSPAKSVSESKSRRFPGAFRWGAALLAAALLSLTALRFYRAREPLKPLRPLPLTRYQGYELQPSISPDGKRVAFVWNGVDGNFDIYTKAVGPGEPSRLTTNPAHEISPSWSPDGTRIAFLRVSPDGRKNVYIIPADGGEERLVGEIHPGYPNWVGDASIMLDRSPGPAWSPDGKYLAISDCPEADMATSLYLLSLETGERKRVTRPAATDVGDYFPVFSPDGRSLAFARSNQLAYQSDVYVLDLGSGSATQVTSSHKIITGPAWISNNRLLYSEEQDGIDRFVTVSKDGSRPAILPGVGGSLTLPAVSRDGTTLIYTEGFRNTNVWRAPIGHAHSGLPERLISSSTKNDSAQYSPDGKRIVFVTDRSGTPEIWTCNADGSDPLLLASMDGNPVGTPRWSPDGNQVVFDALINDRSAVYLVDAKERKPRLFAGGKENYMMPSWSRDGASIYFAIQSGANTEIWKKRLNENTMTQITHHGGREANESSDGSTIYYLADGSGIWQIPANGGKEEPVQGLENAKTSRHFFVNQTGIYFLSTDYPPWIISLYRFNSHKIEEVARIQGTPEFLTPSLSISPDQQWSIYTQLDQSGYDLMILRNFWP